MSVHASMHVFLGNAARAHARLPNAKERPAIPGNWLLPWLVAGSLALILVAFVAVSAQTDVDLDRGENPCRYGGCSPVEGAYQLMTYDAANPGHGTPIGTLTLASQPVVDSKRPERWAGFFAGTLNNEPVRWRHLAEDRVSVIFEWTNFTWKSFVLRHDGPNLRGYETQWSCTARTTEEQVLAEPIATMTSGPAPDKTAPTP